MSNLAEQIEAKRKHVCSSCDLSEPEWTAIDSYNLALTEAAEIVRSSSLEKRNAELEKVNTILIDAIQAACKDMENIPQIMIRSAHNPHANLVTVLEYIKDTEGFERRIEEFKAEFLAQKALEEK